MEEQGNQKKSNLKVALILGAIALLISMWPLYMLKQSVGN
jgi:hypothetical protein